MAITAYSNTTTLSQNLPHWNVLNNTLTSDIVANANIDAKNCIDGYLAKRYNIGNFSDTTTSVPPAVRSLSDMLTHAYARSRMSNAGAEELDFAEKVEASVIKKLEKYINYEMDLVNTAGSVITGISASSMQILASTDDYHSTFNEDDPTKWSQDSNKLDDIADERDV